MATELLLVEDEKSIADTILYRLETDGFTVSWVNTGSEALEYLTVHSPSLIILDIGLPDISGLDVCRTIRKSSDTPILFLTARNDEIDRVVGLELGADDYLAKPFSPRELVARIRAILRRSNPTSPKTLEKVVSITTGLKIDESRKCIIFNGINIDLAKQEFQILSALITHPNQVFSRSQLMESAWDEPGYCTDRAVDAHIKSIRGKLRLVTEHEFIVTHRGFGYSFKDLS